MEPWPRNGPGVVVLPSGRRVRGRGLRRPMPAGLSPTLAVQLSGRRPPPTAWEQRWIVWPDFWLPSDYATAERVLHEAYLRAGAERVEIACGGGLGRTGTALAAWAVFDGFSPRDAVAWTQRHYHPRAVEVPWQRHFLRSLA